MTSYGLGYDDELPGGYQDADLEMLELEEAGRNAGPIPRVHDEHPDNDISDEGELDAFELEPSGQLSIGVEGEQRAIPGLAPEGKPAALNFERDAAEKAAREELATMCRVVDIDDRLAEMRAQLDAMTKKDEPAPPLTVHIVGGEHHGATFELGGPLDPMAGRVNYDPTRGA